ncbi:amidohydrolase family protein [Kibdelosporangium phytohabitans]|uniref:Amidohydrolase-related domain-containing protein n=1 Tax=Kibdelosporangium phytohabitans TaxID=860235 RepID=A0A0N9I2E9_9PSEU|nr:amidohydrolase family protein [Kibdelosporangium phytohabitans]ALG08888.1 hypothetical protein AOZ06_19975 [Kibdelosporangium phytohabitans]MBE1469959.1 cytosine/adenosine deaminase-related metal-dependent hydrolase [Kibdelosporangium phytohabitans]
MGEVGRREFLSWLAKGTFGAASGALLTGQPAAASADITVLTRATVIDATGQPPKKNATVVLAGDRVLAVGHHPELPSVPGVRVIDLAGKHVIPGLWDLHTHSAFYGSTIPALHVVHGVTGIREMWGVPETHDVRELVESGQVLGPRMVIGSAVIDGPTSIWADDAVLVRTAAQARAAVREAKDGGADFIKVYSFLSPECYTAIAEESARLGLRFSGHVPVRVSVQAAIDRRQHTHEHLYNLFTSTARNADELYSWLASLPDDRDSPDWFGRHAQRVEREAVAAHDPARAEALFTSMARRGIRQSPTLLVERQMSLSPETILDDPVIADRLRYIPVTLREQWQAMMRTRPPRTPAEVAELLRFGDARLRLLRTMHEAGVGIVAGTDAGFAYVLPGFALHDELALLVRAGLPPMAALQSATRDAARCLGLAHQAGTVTAGKQADLVVLDADPLADISNTSRIHAVICRGRYLGPRDRTRILAEIEADAKEPVDAPVAGPGSCCHH